MINPFIKLTGADGYGYEAQVFLNINNISGFCIHNNKNITEIASGDETFYITETPEEISAMIQKYYDEQMRMEFIKDALIGISSQIDNRIDHHVIGFVCSNAKSIGNAMMEVLKND